MLLKSNMGLLKFNAVKLYRITEVDYATKRVLVIMSVDKKEDANTIRIEVNGIDSLLVGMLTSSEVSEILECAYTDDRIDLSLLNAERIKKSSQIPKAGKYIGEWSKLVPYKNGWSPFVDEDIQVVVIDTETGEVVVHPDVDMGLKQLRNASDNNSASSYSEDEWEDEYDDDEDEEVDVDDEEADVVDDDEYE